MFNIIMEEGACEGKRAQNPQKSNVAPSAFFYPNKRLLLSLKKLISLKYYKGEVTELKINDSNLNILLPFGAACKHSLPTSRLCFFLEEA